MAAGQYQTRCAWYTRSLAAPTAKGEKKYQFTAAGSLWCQITDRNSSQDTILENRRNSPECTINIRGFVAVKAGDRLVDTGHSESWRVESVFRDHDGFQMVCECWLEDGVER